jgi:hypothetical protein
MVRLFSESTKTQFRDQTQNQFVELKFLMMEVFNKLISHVSTCCDYRFPKLGFFIIRYSFVDAP